MTVNDLYTMIDRTAPFAEQAGFDNSGILVGSPSADVNSVLFALDVTPGVLDEAEKLQADLIVTHHPLLFTPRQSVTDADYEGRLISRMIRMNVSHIAVHTNLDIAPGGINDVLARVCGLLNVQGSGYIRYGELSRDTCAADYKRFLSDALSATVRSFGSPEHCCRKICVCSGSGSDQWKKALEYGADTFISGEIRHHHALEMIDAGLAVFECGHYATERPGILALADTLQTQLHDVQLNLRIFKSCADGYGF